MEKSIKKQNLSRLPCEALSFRAKWGAGSRDFSTRLRLALHKTPIGGNDILNSFQQSRRITQGGHSGQAKSASQRQTNPAAWLGKVYTENGK